MSSKDKNRQKILIADDSEMNRSILADMLEDEFEIVEAANGLQAVNILRQAQTEISLVLLDVVMPEMDGFDVLAVMNRNHLIEDIPVIMITAENSPSLTEKAYEFGVTDYINRPFDPLVVHRRVVNTIMLYAKQKKLIGLVADQIYAKQKSDSMMIEILSHIVEFRNGESALHVLHINTMTGILLRYLVKKKPEYRMSNERISLISTASALHDIGKIAIDERILNKPGKLTPEEYEIIKTHAAIGATMLKKMPFHQDEPLVQTAYEICRWHHERYDGRGYPDGLKGEEIPITAQVVSVCDVYDALTSERVYKEAHSHEKAMQMILNGECGAFNPLLLECLEEAEDEVQKELKLSSMSSKSKKEVRDMTEEMLKHEELSASERTLRLLERERTKYQFFASMSHEIQFECTDYPPILTISDWGARELGIDEVIMNPSSDRSLLEIAGRETIDGLIGVIKNTAPETPVAEYRCKLKINGEERWHKVIIRATWSNDEPPRLEGAIGKIVDIHDEKKNIDHLKEMACHDPLTGLLNHTNARKIIQEILEECPEKTYVLIMFDLDNFKTANDTFGHMFGDQILQSVAARVRSSVRQKDIAARVGGDEFLIFMDCGQEIDSTIARIFHSLQGECNGFRISVSMGIACTKQAGYDYDILFHCADRALYAGKRGGRGQYCFYSEEMKDMLSALSPIDSEAKAQERESPAGNAGK